LSSTRSHTFPRLEKFDYYHAYLTKEWMLAELGEVLADTWLTDIDWYASEEGYRVSTRTFRTFKSKTGSKLVSIKYLR
jgi:hypothetical protein